MHFCMHLIQFSKHFFHSEKHAFWMHQPLFRVPKIFAYVIYFWCAGIKKRSLDAESGLYGGWPINPCFSILEIPLFEPICEGFRRHHEELCAFSAFSDFFERLLAKKGQFWIVHDYLRCCNTTIPKWPVMPKKQATICFDVNYAWKHLMDFSLLGRHIQSIAVLFSAHIYGSIIHQLCRCYT